VTTSQLAGAQMTRHDVDVLRSRRSELRDQLEGATDRRQQLVEQIRHSNGASRTGLEARLQVLDQRIVRLESEIDQTGEQLASAQAQRFSETRAARNDDMPIHFSNVDSDLVVIFSAMLLAPIVLTMARILWKRGSRIGHAPPPLDSAPRLERIEQAIDAIAIEVERVSEGQRFVTRLRAERGAPGLGAAQQPEPVRVPAGEAGRTR
jgi:cell division protein FtsB